MRITEKLLNLDFNGLHEQGAVNIVIFGDSVSHGCFGADEIDYDAAYWNLLRKMLNNVKNYVPVNVINSAIGGTTAHHSLKRMQLQVFDHHPDLLIVCFGLNDVNGSLDDYISSLKIIFEKSISEKVDTIFMTPNMLNTYVADDTEAKYFEYAHKTADMQNSGRMDTYMKAAKELAESMGITVCDCYGKWKELAKTTDTTILLANRINHPTREMHMLFARSLFEIILKDHPEVVPKNDSTMWSM